jgi:hypothetical protein
MQVASRWIVVFGLFGLTLILPASWIGSPRDGMALGILLGGLTQIGLDEFFKKG